MKLLLSSLLVLAAMAALSNQLVASHRVSINRRTTEGMVTTGHHYDVNLTSSVADVKESLAKMYQVPTHSVMVIFRNQQKEDDISLESAEEKLDELYVLVDFRFVEVNTPGGKFFYLGIQQTDTVASLKNKITEKLGVPRDSQRLFCKEGGEELSDNLELYTYEKIEELAFILAVRQSHANVRLPSGELVTFEFEPTERMASLKRRIQEEKGIARERQSFYLDGQELADDALPPSSTLTLMVRSVEQSNKVHVRLASRRLITFEVDLNSDTGASLKSKISEAEGFELANQHLFATPDREILDCRKLSDYLLPIAEQIVDLRVCPSEVDGVLVASLGGSPVGEFTQQLAINSTVTVADIKAELKQKKTILHDCRLHLFADGKELADTEKVSEHIKATGSPYLHLVTRRRAGPSVVHVKLPSGRLMTFEIAPSNKVWQLSAQIQREKQEFKMSLQTLLFGDQQLENNKSLTSYGIESGSTVILKLTPNS